MKSLTTIIILTTVLASCAKVHNSSDKSGSDTPMMDKYGRVRVSPEAKKTLEKEITAGNGDETDVICDRVYKTGSRIPVVTCKTHDEYKRDKEKSRKAAERVRRDSNLNMGKFVD